MGLEDLLGDQLLSKTGNVQTSDITINKIICIYFSAHWCPPCRGFTPILSEFYNQCKANEKELEIVFASKDNTQQQFDDYYGEMAWLCLPFGSPKVQELSEKYAVSGIPSLIVLNSKGNVVVKNGRQDVAGNGAKAFDDWIEKDNK